MPNLQEKKARSKPQPTPSPPATRGTTSVAYDQEAIEIYGAREHNLKNIDVTLPRNQLIVITGISGSGKSSLAFDTIYAEGQRRYMESFSAYARSFMGNLQRPEVDKINGLSPVISIEQKTTSKKPPLDGGDGHRNLRLHAVALCPGGRGLLLPNRQEDGAAVGRPDH